jgi:hypothetical protein
MFEEQAAMARQGNVIFLYETQNSCPNYVCSCLNVCNVRNYAVDNLSYLNKTAQNGSKKKNLVDAML